MTLEMLLLFSLAYLRVLNGLQKASAQHVPSGMQIPFPDVKLHTNWLFTLFFFFFSFFNQDKQHVHVKKWVKDNMTNQKAQQGLMNALAIAYYCNTSLVPLLHYNFQLIYYNCNYIL